MNVLKLAVLFLQAATLVMQWMRDREVAGVAREQALKEMTDALNVRIKAAVDARAAPDDPGVRDEFDRAKR